jgi:hypothetical protein
VEPRFTSRAIAMWAGVLRELFEIEARRLNEHSLRFDPTAPLGVRAKSGRGLSQQTGPLDTRSTTSGRCTAPARSRRSCCGSETDDVPAGSA